jgi:hypothetical protein
LESVALSMMRTRRAAAVLGLFALAAAGVAVAIFGIGRGGGTVSLPTTGEYAPIAPPKITVPLVGGVLLGDLPRAGVGGDLDVLLSLGKRPRTYELTVTNISSIGFVKAFKWFPSSELRILKVTGSTSGRCKLSGTTGFGGNQFKTVVLHPNILCEKVDLRPPTCTCKADGGTETITFVAAQDKVFGAGGQAQVVAMRPIVEIIPSYVQAEQKTAKDA